jgi:hypothetical protein
LKLKNLLVLLFLSLQICACGTKQGIIAQAEDPDNEPYLGTWAYQNRDKIFRLFIKEEEKLNGDDDYWIIGNYEMVEVNPVTGLETLLFTSILQNVPEWYGAINGYAHHNILSGLFKEIHANGLQGTFTITLESSCLTCPQKIRWKV